MSRVLVASPYLTLPPPVAQILRTSCQHVWEGPDGSLWDISGRTSGVRLLAGTRGLERPPITRYKAESAVVDGSWYRGSHVDERDVVWFLKIWKDDTSQEFIEHNRAWWRTLYPTTTGRWLVTQPNGEQRSLRCRYASQEDGQTTAPELIGYRFIQVNLVADEEPLWLGDPITRQFSGDDGQDYYGGDSGGGFGPDYFISVGPTLDTATITNPGDVETWPTYKVSGPTTTVQVGIGGRFVSFPMTLTGGQWVQINTNPTDQVAVDHAGVDRTAQLGLVDFAPIPAGTSLPLELTMTGTGTVDVSITPRYYEAY